MKSRNISQEEFDALYAMASEDVERVFPVVDEAFSRAFEAKHLSASEKCFFALGLVIAHGFASHKAACNGLTDEVARVGDAVDSVGLS